MFDRRDDADARATLAKRYDGLVHRLVRRFRGRGAARDDLVQTARYGLLNAIDRFDPKYGVRFATFASRTMVGELKHYFRDSAWSVRVPRSLQNLWLRTSTARDELSQEFGRPPSVDEIAEALDVDSDDVVEALDASSGYRPASLDRPVADSPRAVRLGDTIGDRDKVLERAPLRAELSEAMESIPERERSIIYLRFFEGKTQKEIAEVIGVSQVHVSRLLRGTLAKLRRRVAGR